MLRVIDLKNGQTVHIFNLSNLSSDHDYTSFRYIPSLQKLALGTSGGNLTLHDGHSGELLETFR